MTSLESPCSSSAKKHPCGNASRNVLMLRLQLKLHFTSVPKLSRIIGKSRNYPGKKWVALNCHKAKVAWSDVCQLLKHGGLGIKQLKQPELLQKFTEGTFTWRIMYEQFQIILKMGPIGQVFSMLPRFSSELMPKGREKESQAKLKCYMTMMDSMTNEELDSTNPKLMNDSRIMRTARGSGRPVKEVQEMLEEYKRLVKIWSKMKGLKLPKKGEMSALSRNLNAQHMSKVLPPQMLKQMGGMGGLQNLIKQMGGIGGMGGKDMMGMFGGGDK